MSIYITPMNDIRRGLIKNENLSNNIDDPYRWFEYFLSEAVKNKNTHILFQEEQERAFNQMHTEKYADFFEDLNTKLVQHNIQFVIAFSGYPKNKNYKFQEKYSNITIYNTPLYFLNFLYYLDKVHINKLSEELKTIAKNNQFKKLFITLNNKPHDFRCELMDTLTKNNLLEVGTYSWLKDGDTYGYQFKYFDNKYQKLNFDSNNGRDFYWKDLLHDSPLINLISESDDSIIGISEKTCKSILIGQPFIVYSAKGFHKVLTEFGFELYDELFDYSFDSCEDRTDRIVGICNNLNNLRNKNLSDLYNLVFEKIEKNKQTALEIIKHRKFINNEYLDLLINHKDQFVNQENPFRNKISTFNFFNLDK